MTRAQDFPIPLQNDMISANLNSSLVLQFFTGRYIYGCWKSQDEYSNRAVIAGIYTAIYAVTMYTYRTCSTWTRTRCGVSLNFQADNLTWIVYRHEASLSNKRIITGTLTLLYSTIMAEVGLGWYYATTTFSTQGDSKLAIFVASATGASTSPVLNAMSIILGSAGFLLADGIMV